jgi:hypothetical protein
MRAFTGYGFKATGTTTNRTMPDRLAEVKNVMDFGAVGNGSTNDAAAIQAAIDWTDGPDRGTIYFPPCSSTYRISTPLTLNYDGPLTIRFQGSGYASRLDGNNLNGFIFTRTLGTPANEATVAFDQVYMTNSHATGGLCRIGSSQKVSFRDCQFGGHHCYTAENTDGGLASTNTMFSSCIFAGAGTVVGSVGIIMAGGVIEATDVRGFDVGYRISGYGTTIWGGRTERNNTAMEFGVGDASAARGAAADIGAGGVAIIGHTFEGNWIGMHFDGTTQGFFASGILMQGHASENSGATLALDGTQIGVWIPADKLQGACFNGFDVGNVHEVAGYQIDTPTSRPGITFMNCAGTVTGGGVDWLASSKAMAAKWINCPAMAGPIYTFTDLPDASNRLEGDEYDISDSSTATWGATVTGSGANRVRTRFNGTNWTVVGI